MIGNSGVGDIGAGHARHVAFNAVILGTSPAALRSIQRAALFVMTRKAPGPIEFQFFFSCGIVMRVVASQTAKLFARAAALLKTSAGVHLLDVPDRPLRIHSV